jgi:hypothetical protein
MNGPRGAGMRLATAALVVGLAGAVQAAPAGAVPVDARPGGAATASVNAVVAPRLDPQQLALGDPSRKGRQAPVRLDGITDTATGELIAAGELARRLGDVRVLFVGEEHTNGEFHRVQRRVIEALHAAGRK